MRSAARSGLLLLAIAALGAGRGGAAPAPAPETLGFVHVAANTGGASGGHTALRVGEHAYHYQFHGDGTLRLDRLAWQDFLHQYGSLENRSLRVAQVPISVETRKRVARRFARLLLVQERHLDRLDALGLEARFFEARAQGQGGLELRGVGLFETGPGSDRAALALRSAVRKRLGPGFLPAELGRVEEQVAASAERESQPSGGPPVWDSYPSPNEIEAERRRDALQLRASLAVLEEARSLDRAAILDLARVDPIEGARPLAPYERDRLRALAAQLTDDVVRLVRSERPDRGIALLVATARHQVVSRSLEENRLLVLDPLPPDSVVLDQRQVARRRAALARLADQQSGDYIEARRIVLGRAQAGSPGSLPGARTAAERELRLLEQAISRYFEVEGAVQSGSAVRGSSDAFPVPARAGAAWLPSSADRDADAARAERARSRELRWRRELRRTYAYGLFGHNCATELVRGIGSAFEDPEAAQDALGGDLRPGRGLGFVPVGLAAQVERALPVSETRWLPSFRRRTLEAMAASEPAVRVWLRESNTLTSSVYERSDGDGSFLFFTEEAWPIRPLLGALNLGTALGHAALGVITAPFDRGHALAEGLHGAAFSVPELFFVNIRKGTFDFVPREDP